MTLYGAIPLMQAHRKGSTVGVFWLNAAETWIDIVKSKSSVNPLSLGVKGSTTTQTHWYSESGLLDVFVFLGPTPKDVIKTYTDLTGTTSMPPEFAIISHIIGQVTSKSSNITRSKPSTPEFDVVSARNQPQPA